MRIAIRMDDITPDMDWKNFRRFKELLDEHGIKPLIGVVPDNRDHKLMTDRPKADFWQYVRALQQDGWSIAMHGYNHLYTTAEGGMFPIGCKSEFAGLPLARQKEMIKGGKEILESRGIFTDIFMAPSHSFDRNTLRALRANGFYIITDGFGIAPFRQEDMVFYPISFKKSRSLKDRRDGIVTFVYHTNTMNDRDFEGFEKLLSTDMVVSYDEYTRFEVKDRNPIGRAAQYVMATGKRTAAKLVKLKG